ncbi:MAG: ribulose phosphate epimerase [Spirochaetes bacterium]|nr:MAG: ribulose phosphate epimerase [Spirochaetota bacterium]
MSEHTEEIEVTQEDAPGGGYVIHVENFDGPLDLLWSLIKKAKIDITEISISGITEQYIEYLKLMEKLNIQVAADFIVMASELLYYKSKALLPGGDLEDEYFVPPLPPELIQKLLEYKKYQTASRELRTHFEMQADSYVRENELKGMFREEELIEVSLFDLLSAFADIMDSRGEIEQKEIVFDEILVSDRIIFIMDMLRKSEQILFLDIFPDRPSRGEIVATFLAILEMAKTARIRVMQHRVFGDIRIVRNFDPAAEDRLAEDKTE